MCNLPCYKAEKCVSKVFLLFCILLIILSLVFWLCILCRILSFIQSAVWMVQFCMTCIITLHDHFLNLQLSNPFYFIVNWWYLPHLYDLLELGLILYYSRCFTPFVVPFISFCLISFLFLLWVDCIYFISMTYWRWSKYYVILDVLCHLWYLLYHFV